MTTTVQITNQGPQTIGYAVVDPLDKDTSDPVFVSLAPNTTVNQNVWLHQMVLICEMQDVDLKA